MESQEPASQLLLWEQGLILLFCFHALGAAFAFFAFWLPLCSDKGSLFHIHAGWTFLTGAVIASCSSALIAWFLLYNPIAPEEGLALFAFRLFLALWTLISLTQAIGAIRSHRTSFYGGKELQLALSFLLFFSAMVISCLGMISSNLFMTLFPGLALFASLWQVHYWRDFPATAPDWLFTHMRSMFAAALALLTGFFTTTLPYLTFGHLQGPFVSSFPILLLLPFFLYWELYTAKEFPKDKDA